MPRATPPIPDRVLDIFRRQDHVIHRVQALSGAMTMGQIEQHLRLRRWTRLAPCVYLASPGPASDEQVIRAVSLWAGPSAVIVGPAALFWQRRRTARPTSVDVAVGKQLRALTVRSASGPIQVVGQRRVLHEDFVVRWHGILTARTETVIHDLLPIEGPALLDDAIRQRWVTLPMVEWVQLNSRSRRGSVLRSTIIKAAATGGISEGERLLHRHLRAAGITGWRANGAIRAGGATVFADAVFDELRLVIEIDGFAFHSSHERFQHDRARQNWLVGSEWTVLRFTWWQLTNEPDKVVRQVRETIGMLERRKRQV